MTDKKPLTLKKKIIRSSIVIAIIVAVLVLMYYILVWTGVWEYINSVEKIRQLILSAGFWGRFAFVSIQFLQVTFVPIPSTISTLAGVLIYGPLEAALLSFAGIMLGSVVAFALGKTFGRKLVIFMVGEESCNKWEKFLSNGKYSFFIMMVLPMFPDDVLCLVAGLTDMSWAFFVITNLIARPIGIFTTCYIGSGEIIPYHGWGLVAWAFIIIIVAVLIFLSFKYRDQIENFLQKTFKTKKKTATKNCEEKDAIILKKVDENEQVNKEQFDKKEIKIEDVKVENLEEKTKKKSQNKSDKKTENSQKNCKKSTKNSKNTTKKE